MPGSQHGASARVALARNRRASRLQGLEMIRFCSSVTPTIGFLPPLVGGRADEPERAMPGQAPRRVGKAMAPVRAVEGMGRAGVR